MSPEPIAIWPAGPITARIFFVAKAHKYVVRVSHEDGRELTGEFKAHYAPLFGMDVIDMAEAEQIAERLAKELEGGG